MKKFLSCDWGTSSFRLRLVATEHMNVLAETNSDQGIASTFGRWETLGSTDRQERAQFYLDIVLEHIAKIEQELAIRLKGIPLICSGMASSSVGMVNLPYQALPFKIDGSDLEIVYLKKRASFEHPVLLISGVRSEDDVMRGEETQLIGAMTDEHDVIDERIYIFPGTHSKHIVVRGQQAVSFKTYMTGEYFELLSKKSILSVGVEKPQDGKDHNDLQSFQQGVRDAVGSNLLHTSFLVRTNNLFGKLTKKQNFYYLSGLVIGTELQELLSLTFPRIFLCSSSHLKSWYEAAFSVLGIEERLHVFSEQQADEAVIKGQFAVYKYFNSKK